MLKWLRGTSEATPFNASDADLPESPITVREVADKPDFSDGRDWEPLNVADGNPRLLLTVTPMEIDGETRQVISIDHWNLNSALVEDLYLQALPTIRAYQRQLRGDSDAQPARMDTASED